MGLRARLRHGRRRGFNFPCPSRRTPGATKKNESISNRKLSIPRPALLISRLPPSGPSSASWFAILSSDNGEVSDGSQPPMTLNLSLSESAGSRSLDRLVELSRFAASTPVAPAGPAQPSTPPCPYCGGDTHFVLSFRPFRRKRGPPLRRHNPPPRTPLLA